MKSKILGLCISVSEYRRTTPGLPFSIKTVQHTLDLKLMCDSAPSGGFEEVLHNVLCFPLFIYQSGLELLCACSEEF